MSDYTVSGSSTLDVGPFLRALAQMDAALDKVETKIGNVDRAIDRLGRKDVTVRIGLDSKSAEAGILKIEEKLAALQGKTIQVTTRYSTAGVPGSVSTPTGSNIDTSKIDNASRSIDRLRQNSDKARASGEAMKGAYVAAAAILSPTAVVAAGLAAGALGALSAVVVGGAGAFLAGKAAANEMNTVLKDQAAVTKALAGGDWTKISEAYQKQQIAMEKLGPVGQQTVALFQELKSTAANFGSSFKDVTFSTFNDGISTATELLGKAEPVAQSAMRGINGVVSSIKQQVDSGGFDSFFRYLDNTAQPIIDKLGQGVINFARTFTNLIPAMDPLTQMVVNGFNNMSTAAFKWSQGLGQSSGWHTFVKDVQTYGPQIWQTIKQIVVTVGDLVNSLMPLGGGALAGLRAIADILSLITKLPMGNFLIQMAAVGFAVKNLTAPLGGVQGIGQKLTGTFSSMGTAAKSEAAAGLLIAADSMGTSAESAVKAESAAAGLSTQLRDTRENAASLGEGVSKAKEKLGGLEVGASRASKVMGGLKAAGAGVVGMFGGPWGIALTAAVTGISLITNAVNNAKAAHEATINTMKDYYIAEKAGGDGATEAAKKLAQYQQNVDQSKTALDHLEASQKSGTLTAGKWGNITQIAAQGVSDKQKQLNKDYEESKKRADDYWNGLTPVEQAQARVTAASIDLTKAIRDHGAASDEAKAKQAAYDTELAAATVAQNKYAIATQSSTDQMLSFMSGQISAVGSAINLSNAQLAVKDAQKQVNDLLKAGKGGTDEFTAAENNLESSILSAADAAGKQAGAMAQAAGSQDTASASALGLYQNLKQQADMAGGTLPGRLGALWNSLNSVDNVTKILTGTIQGFGMSVYQVPGEKYVRIDAPTAAQEQQLQALGLHILTLPNGHVLVSADTWTAEQQIDAAARDRYSYITVVYRQSGSYSGRVGGAYTMATGGYVQGEGTSTSDSIAARLSNGEYVVKASAVDKFGVRFFDMLNQGKMAYLASMPQFSSGGPVTIPNGTKRGGDGGFSGGGGDGGDNIGMFISPGAVIVNNFHPTDSGQSVNKELARLGAFGAFGG